MTVTRRQFLVASAGAVWTAPQILSVSRASAADLHSRPTPPRTTTKTSPPMGAALPKDLPGMLAYTGQEPERDAVVGVAAVVAGAALVAVNRKRRDMQ